ncbi:MULTISPECIES: hypothetical protein [unclassified Neorhizobium]|uniref:hypothetical protein n=1 Tax=unclassified Neorhizobium TaxID=2629175 RepID=UPI001FF58CDE|nr:MULTISPECIES: hypothetical protein [unclassified Neorhizobium]MCJ9672911.1 hypothetical protein [Neorhizobium sp. SHOUNA12B]MCJ9748548.1 hypothetical protein [Neorhizobium sp. SHOUNA12A]
MNDNKQTLKREFDLIRAEIDAGLNRLEKSGGCIQDAAADLTKMGIALALASIGPMETLRGLFAHGQMLREAYPQEAAEADSLNVLAGLSVEGTA